MEEAQCYAGRQAAQPNDTFIGVYSGTRSNGTSNSTFVLWCCSNSTESYVGNFTGPNGSTLSHNFKDFNIQQYDRSSSYKGCIQLEGYMPYENYGSGLYTCNIPDASGRNQIITFSLYDQCSK